MKGCVGTFRLLREKMANLQTFLHARPSERLRRSSISFVKAWLKDQLQPKPTRKKNQIKMPNPTPWKCLAPVLQFLIITKSFLWYLLISDRFDLPCHFHDMLFWFNHIGASHEEERLCTLSQGKRHICFSFKNHIIYRIHCFILGIWGSRFRASSPKRIAGKRWHKTQYIDR